jgi:hypothetical protein
METEVQWRKILRPWPNWQPPKPKAQAILPLPFSSYPATRTSPHSPLKNSACRISDVLQSPQSQEKSDKISRTKKYPNGVPKIGDSGELAMRYPMLTVATPTHNIATFSVGFFIPVSSTDQWHTK